MTPSNKTRAAAHLLVGSAAAVVANKLFGARGTFAILATAGLAALLHEQLDAPVAQAMVNLGFQL